jgi:hypothetical protein
MCDSHHCEPPLLSSTNKMRRGASYQMRSSFAVPSPSLSAGFVVLRLRLGDAPRLLFVSRFEHIPTIVDQVLQPARRQAQGGGIRGLNVG